MHGFEVQPDAPPRCPSCSVPLPPDGACPACALRLALRPPVAGPAGGEASIGAFRPPREWGDYRVEERLGEGAMGVVHRARKLSLKKDVAIKFIKAGRAASDRQRALFLREAELASQLDHPNIVSVLEVGEWEGVAFLVMRLIEGRPLSEEFLEADFRPMVRERMSLLVEVARAVHHGHQRGLIHRDLKPGNILVDRDGAPHVADFGLARWAEQASDVTYGEGLAVGTPAYMPPEQAAGRRADLTIASDVWSLGVILFQLLSGRLPFEATSVPGILHRILHEEPPPPFGFLEDARKAGNVTSIPPPTDAARLSRAARRDLTSICGRCLERDPARRYPTAGAFADDLERWLGGRPVEARPIPALERGVRWARRRPALASLAVASVIAVAALGAALQQMRVNRITEHQGAVFNYETNIRLAADALLQRNAIIFDRAMTEAEAGARRERLRGLEWGLLRHQGNTVFPEPWFRGEAPLLALSVNREGTAIATVDTNRLTLLDGTGKVRWVLAHPPDSTPGSMTFHPAGSLLAAGGRGGLDLISVDTGERQRWAADPVEMLAFSTDGRWLVVGVQVAVAPAEPAGATRGEVRIYDVVGRRLDSSIPGEGRALWCSSERVVRLVDGYAQVSEWVPASPTWRPVLPRGYFAPAVQFSPAGRWMLRTSNFGAAHLVELGSGRELASLQGGLAETGVVGFSPDERWAAITTGEGAVRMVPAVGGGSGSQAQASRTLAPGHVEPITAIAFTGDGRTLFTASRDRTIRRLDTRREAAKGYVEVENRLESAAGVAPSFSPDGRWAAVLEVRPWFFSAANGDSTILWDTANARVAGRIPSEVVGWSDGGKALSWDRDGRLRIWQLSDPAQPRAVAGFRLNPDHHSDVDSQLADDGQWVVSLTRGGGVQAFDVGRGRAVDLNRAWLGALAPGGRTNVDFLAASPASATVALGIDQGGTVLWDLRRNRVRSLQATVPAEIRFSPDGGQVAVTDYEGHRLRLFDVATGAELRGLRGHQGPVAAVAFTPDGRRLITGGDDTTLVIWNLETGREVYRQRLDAPICWIRVSPDQQWLVVGLLPNEVGAQRGSLGPGHYRFWRIAVPAEGWDVETSRGHAPRDREGADTIWGQYPRLAERHPARD